MEIPIKIRHQYFSQWVSGTLNINRIFEDEVELELGGGFRIYVKIDDLIKAFKSIE